jgi:plastocyanin
VRAHHPIARAAANVAGVSIAAVLLLGACGDEGDGADAATTSPGPADSAMTDGGDGGASSDPGAGGAGAGDASTVSCTAGAAGEGATDVEISGFTFRPGDVEIEAGSSVTFTNGDGADHSVWSAERVDGDPAWLSAGSDPEFRLPEVLHEGDASTCTFVAPGTYEYLCGVHNSMTGTVVVR